METPIQELIKWIDADILNNPNYDESPRIRIGAQMIRIKATELLAKEKEQIVNAWQEGYYAESDNEENDSNKYFDETYNINQ